MSPIEPKWRSFNVLRLFFSKTRPHCLVCSHRDLDSQSASMLLRDSSVQRTYGGSVMNTDLISIKGDFPLIIFYKNKE